MSARADRIGRRPAAILAADAAGYSNLIEADEGGHGGPAQGAARRGHPVSNISTKDLNDAVVEHHRVLGVERANLKEQHRNVYDCLVAQWNEWNATMLPLDPQSLTGGFTGDQLADHFGVKAKP